MLAVVVSLSLLTKGQRRPKGTIQSSLINFVAITISPCIAQIKFTYMSDAKKSEEVEEEKEDKEEKEENEDKEEKEKKEKKEEKEEIFFYCK